MVRDIYHALRAIYLQYSRWQELADLLRAEIKLLEQDTENVHESVELYQELALIYETQLKRVPEAITCWNQVRKIRPKDLLLFII